MKSLSLLERIGRGVRQGYDQDDAGAVESVLDHLRRMLNTRQGHVLTAPDYGMPDFTGFVHSPDARRGVQTAIFDSIRKYEPRLKKVQVNYLESDGLEIRFEVKGTLQADHRGIPVRYETRMQPSGRVRVSG